VSCSDDSKVDWSPFGDHAIQPPDHRIEERGEGGVIAPLRSFDQDPLAGGLGHRPSLATLAGRCQEGMALGLAGRFDPSRPCR